MMTRPVADPLTPPAPELQPVVVLVAPPSRAANILRLACWFALVGGSIETIARWVQYGVFHKLPVNMMHPHAPWMTLAGGLAVYMTVGSMLALAARLWPRIVPFRVAGAIFALVFLWGMNDVITIKPGLAFMFLASCLAIAAARSAASLFILARRTLWLVAAIAACLVIGPLVSAAVMEARANAALLPGSPVAPNVLLIVLDTVRAQNLSLHGYPRPTTPHLEQLARRGVCFDRAISTVSWTLPSHASLFTGRYPQELFHDLPHIFDQAAEAPMDGTYATLAEFLGGQGYRTAGVVANAVFCDRTYGLSRGFVHYVDYEMSLQQVIKSSVIPRTLADWTAKALHRRMILARKDGLTVNTEFLRWLDRSRGRPFFGFLNYMETHDPYDPPAPFAGRFSAADRPAAGSWAGMTPPSPNAASEMDEYDCCLAALDRDLDLLLGQLDRRGLLADTIVIVTADHGEHFGEHGRFLHGDTLYLPVIHVPLLVVWPGRVPAGVRVHGPASLRNLPATIVDLLGLAAISPFPGSSLRGLWQGTAASPAYSNLDMCAKSSNTVRLRSLVDDRYHYIEGTGTPVQHLYDLEHDPAEERDLANTAEGRPVIEGAHALLERNQTNTAPGASGSAPAGSPGKR